MKLNYEPAAAFETEVRGVERATVTALHGAANDGECGALFTRTGLITAARLYRDVRFRHQGRDACGMDCVGLIAVPAASIGSPEALAFLKDPTCKGYGRQPEPRVMVKALARYMDEIPKASARMADVLWMEFDVEPQHFALITWFDSAPTGKRQPVGILHASATEGKVVEHGVDAMWRKRVVRAYRYRGIGDG